MKPPDWLRADNFGRAPSFSPPAGAPLRSFPLSHLPRSEVALKAVGRRPLRSRWLVASPCPFTFLEVKLKLLLEAAQKPLEQLLG